MNADERRKIHNEYDERGSKSEKAEGTIVRVSQLDFFDKPLKPVGS